MQGSRLSYVQQLTALKALLLSGGPNLTGNAPVTALAACLPPDLETLHLMHDELSEVGQQLMLCRVCKAAVSLFAAIAHVAMLQDVAWQLLLGVMQGSEHLTSDPWQDGWRGARCAGACRGQAG